jgi:hypothetical protein
MPKVPTTGKQDFASYLVTHAQGNAKLAAASARALASRQGAETEKAGVLSRLFDTLSTGLYTMTNITDTMAEQDPDKSFIENLGDDIGDIGKAIGGGAVNFMQDTFAKPILSVGKHLPGIGDDIERKWNEIDKTAREMNPRKTNEDILHERFGVDNKIARYGGGFALDLLLDPLNLAGAGFLRQGAGAAQKGINAADELTRRAAKPEGLVQEFNMAKAQQGGLMKMNVPKPKAMPVAEQATKRNMVPNPLADIGKVQTPRTQVGTPLMDEALNSLKFAPRHRKLMRRQEQRYDKLASDVRRGIVDIPNPARNAVQKQQRAQYDWERQMTSIGEMTSKGGRRINIRGVNQIIHDIQSGKIANNVINPAPATGAVAAKAKSIADELIDSAMGQKWSPSQGRYIKASGSFTKRALPTDVTPVQQVRLYRNILRHLDDVERSPEIAKQALVAAENHLISLGVQPVAHDGIRVRLSHVMEAIGDSVSPVKILDEFVKKNVNDMDPIVRTAVNGLKAQRSLNMSDILGNLSQYVAKATDDVTRDYVGAAKVVKEKEIVQSSIEAAMQAGMSAREVQAARDLFKDIVDLDKLPAEKWVEQSVALLFEATAKGTANPKLIKKFNDAIVKGLGPYENLGMRVSDNKVVDTFMNHMTTWWGRGAWKNVAVDVFTAHARNAELRAETLRRFSQQFSGEEQRAAFRVIAGFEENTDPRVLEFADKLNDYLARLYKTAANATGKTNKYIDGSVADKSMATMEDVNRQLKDINSYFQFTRSRRARPLNNPIAKPRDYSEGTDWMRSWELAEPTDPVKFMYDLDLALERTTAEYAFLDDFVGRFGSLVKTADHNMQMPLSRIKGFYVPDEIGRQIVRIMDDIQKGQWAPKSKLGRFYGRMLHAWKAGVTIYLPSHHIRNGIGDTYLMWLAGHSDPRVFTSARRVMETRHRYKVARNQGNFGAIDEVTDPQAMKWAETRGGDVIIDVNGQKLTADQIYTSAWQHGLLIDVNRFEDIYGEAPLGEISAANTGLKKFMTQPLGGKAHDTATAAAEYREHYIRLAHYIAATKKNLKKGRSLKQATDDAAHEVRKWHPDGTDLTQFEQKIRYIVPFYSWLRKSTPLLLQSLVTAPAKNMVYPKGMVALQNMLGIDATMLDPFPDDQLFPEWMRGYGMGPIGDPQSENAIASWFGTLGKNMIDIEGKPYGYTVISPGNPLVDFGGQFLGMGARDTTSGAWNAITPFIKAPVELAQNRDFVGAPITKDKGGGGVVPYLLKQIPFTAPAARTFNWGDKQREGKEQQGFDKEGFLNQLTALGVRGSGPHIKTAEFEAKERIAAKKRRQNG